MKRFFCLLTLVLMGIALLAACSGLGGGGTGSGSRGRKLRDTDVIIDYGMVTRGGEQTIVCAVCDQNAIYLYCDDEEHELFDTAMLPTEELYDREVWNEDWVLGTIDFSDVTNDNNGDLQVTLSHSDMSESYLTWMWEEGEGYVYQPDDSTFYHSIVVRYPDEEPEKPEYDFSMYEGLWKGDADAGSKYDCDEAYLEFDAYGYWELYSGGDWIDAGYLWYEPDWDATYIYCHQGGSIGGTINGSRVELESDQLSISDCGCFSREDAQTYHLASSVLQGTWYLDNDCSMESYIVINGYGNWSLCQRKPGSSETEEIDHGTFSFETDGPNIFSADSHVSETSLRVFYFEEDGDDGVIVWGEEDTYYRMER
ncbi:hypothetical protein HMPREF9470_05596 [[Clostridium] citroniae WAL-19142]|nr:hypothetical protein HMPREF9470_05596 [[Clostridium] citroniae WAL-19142]